MKKNSKLSLKRLFVNKKPLIIVAMGMFMIGQLVFDGLIARHVHNGDNSQIINLIISAVESANKPAPVDARTGATYFPEAKVMVPMDATYPVELHYNYYPQTGSVPEELLITNQQTVHAAESRLLSLQTTSSHWWGTNDPKKVLAEVPNLQLCARGIHLRFTTSESAGFKLESSVALSDGRTAYLYTEAGKTCQAGDELNSVLAVLGQAKSY